jgi:uncharacterized protein YjlB
MHERHGNTSEVLIYPFGDDGSIPNHPRWPMILYKGAFAEVEGDRAQAIEATFHGNGWTHSWRNGIYAFPHFHSNAHEVLGIARGSATVRFGGQAGNVVEIKAGDVALLPAGTGHQSLSASSDLLVIGAYPPGCTDWDLCRGSETDRARLLSTVASVPVPETDPVHGSTGPMHEYWTSAAGPSLA